MQVGADTDILQNDDAVENRVGGYVGAGTFRSDVSHFDGTPAGRGSLKAYSVGVYWNRTSADGWYLEGVGQYTRYDKVEFASVQGIHGQTSGQGIAASIEGGKSMALNENWRIEPQAQLVVQRTSLDDMRDSQNNTASLGSSDSVLGRLGARLVHKWDAANSVWLRTDAWHEFSGKSGATYQTISGPLSYKADLGGSWGELSVGASAWVTPSILIQGSVGYQRNLGGIRREATNLGGSVSAGGAPTAGVGLSVQLTPNAKLTTKVSYANGPKGSVDGGVSANVGLEAKW